MTTGHKKQHGIGETDNHSSGTLAELNNLISDEVIASEDFVHTNFIHLSGDNRITGDLIPSISGINLGTNTYPFNSLHTYYINIATTTPPDWDEGTMFWDMEDKTLSLYSSISGVTLQVGQEQWIRAKNITGGILANGSVVYINGVSGNTPTIAKASASSHVTSHTTIGVCTHDINHGDTGYITTFGLVRGIDTRGFAPGDKLYLSTTAGELTNILYDSPIHKVFIGYALNSTVNGSILVRIRVGIDLYDLDNVSTQTSSVIDGDILMWNDSLSAWTNSDILTNIFNDTNEPTGFPRDFPLLLGDISFNDGNRTFTIAPKAGQDNFTFFANGIKYERTSADEVTITDTEGLWFIYYNTSQVLTASQTPWTFGSGLVFVALIYWDATNNKGVIGDERHGLTMDHDTHEYLHNTAGATYKSGFTPSLTVDGNGSLNAHAEMQSIATGQFFDEDILFTNDEQTTYEIWYKTGAGVNWRWDTASAAVVKCAPAGRPYFNQFIGGAWQLTEIDNIKFMLMHIFATNRNTTNNKVIFVMGENQYTTKADAQTAAENEIYSITTGAFPTPEFIEIATIIIEARDSFTNTYNARVVSTSEGADFIDFRTNEKIGIGGIATDHGNLAGLSDDDHLQYALLDGTRDFTGTVGGIAPLLSSDFATKAYVDTRSYATIVNTPVDNQLAIWTGANAIEGDSKLTWSGTQFAISGQIYSKQATTLIPAGTTQTIDWNNGNSQVLDLGSASGDVTLTLSNPVAGASYFLKIIQGGTARDVVLPSSVLIPGGSAPTTLDISIANDAIDSLVLYYDGSKYLANFNKAYG